MLRWVRSCKVTQRNSLGAGVYFGSEGWQELFGCLRRDAAFGPMVEKGEFCEADQGGADLPLTLLFESADIVAVSKPAGSSTEDVLRQLSAKLKRRITQTSRLDLPTSGVLVAAVGGAISCPAWWLLAQFAGRLVSKCYLCLCFGRPPAGSEGEVSSPLKTTHSPEGYSRTEANRLTKSIQSSYLLGAKVCKQSSRTRCHHLAFQREPGTRFWPVLTDNLLVSKDGYLSVSPACGCGIPTKQHLAIQESPCCRCGQ